MSFTFGSQLFGGILLLSLLSQVIGHSYVTSPITRSNQAERLTGCRGPNCLGPCDAPLSSIHRSPISAMRGEPITIKWPRNNHAGGFIRFAWAPTSQSDSHEAFDSHVQQINCHEVGGCYPDDPSSPNGGDSGPADGSSRACSTNLTIPHDLTDGQWTLQWSWFGGAFALGDYFSCVDYNIVGGGIASMTPVFIGGDYSHPATDKCKFFNTDKLHVCVNEPCQNALYPISTQQFGAPAAGQLGTITVDIPSADPANSDDSSSSSSTSSDVDSSSSSSGLVDSPSDVSSSSSSSSGDLSSSNGEMDNGAISSTSSSGSSSSSENSLSSSSGETVPSNGNEDLSSSSSSGDMMESSSSSTGDNSMSSSSTSGEPSSEAPSTESSSTSSSSSSGSLNQDSSSGDSSMDIPSDNVPQDSTTSSMESSTSSSYGCVLGSMECIGDGQYRTCTNGREANYWSNAQNCHPGLSCHASGSFIYCY